MQQKMKKNKLLITNGTSINIGEIYASHVKRDFEFHNNLRRCIAHCECL